MLTTTTATAATAKVVGCGAIKDSSVNIQGVQILLDYQVANIEY